MPSRIVENTSKEKFKMGDVAYWGKLYVLCSGPGFHTVGGHFRGVVIHQDEKFAEFPVGSYSDIWCIEKFKKVSVTIEFT